MNTSKPNNNQNRGERELGDDDSGYTDPSTIKEYKEALNQAKNKRDHFKEKYLRKVADLKNLKQRKEKEAKKQRKYANKELLFDLLEILDNFNRALESMNFESEDVNEGVSMIKKQLDDLLKKYEVKEINAKGEEFDPNYHEAMMQEKRPGIDKRIVLEVLQKGYTIHDQVLRPAQVKVSVPVDND